MGGCDWFQASASAVGIPGVASSDTGHDTKGGYDTCVPYFAFGYDNPYSSSVEYDWEMRRKREVKDDCDGSSGDNGECNDHPPWAWIQVLRV